MQPDCGRAASYNHVMLIILSRKLVTVRTCVTLVCLVAAFSALSAAKKEFAKPAAHPAKAYPANDSHPEEKVAVGVDPYDMPDKAQIFTVDYHEHGFVPIFVVITNDGDQPISLTGMKAQLVTKNRSKLFPSTPDDIYRALAHPSMSGTPNPLPWPKKKVKGTVGKEALDEINEAQFSAHAVEPHTTQSGFLFYDVSGISAPLAGANFYLTGVRDAKGQELMYFEIPMEKYLSAPQPKPAAQ
jgi:hypothetical protein